jgi:AcrR family transcriptional regulator
MSSVKAERAARTRRTLVRTGRRLFARQGFDGVSAEEIVAAAKVTRGALYHHFDGGKEGLFRAVVTDVMREVHDRLAAAARGARSPLDSVQRGVRSFLEACSDPAYLQVLLVDGPAVLGWHEWRALDLEFGLGLLRSGLEAAAKAGEIAAPDVETATHLIAGALIDGAMLVGKNRGDAAVRRAVNATMVRMLRGLVVRTRTRRLSSRRTEA